MIDTHQLPALNAILNGTSGIWLIFGFVFIRRGRVAAHRACMIGAFVTSVLFLTSYIIYHSLTGSTPFQSQGWIRPVYFTILFTHTPLAVLIVPLILVTLRRAIKKRFEAHRRLARITWPLWMYVSVTGVLIYFMLYHLDPYLMTRG